MNVDFGFCLRPNANSSWDCMQVRTTVDPNLIKIDHDYATSFTIIDMYKDKDKDGLFH